MLAYVDIQHPVLVNDPQKGPAHWQMRHAIRRKIEEATGLPCTLIHYTKLTPAWLAQNNIRAIMISGNSFDWCDYDWRDFGPLQDIIRQGEMPVLGFCGGHQLIAMTLGGECDAMGPLPPDAADPPMNTFGGTMKERGMKKESGVVPIRIVRPDPLLAELPNPFMAWQGHYWEVKRLPDGFMRLAETDLCAVQVMRHMQKPLCGTQFHPERYEADFPAGRQILYNFCHMYGLA
jgi:GMP synthase (glutamine-hydrolysing)